MNNPEKDKTFNNNLDTKKYDSFVLITIKKEKINFYINPKYCIGKSKNTKIKN